MFFDGKFNLELIGFLAEVETHLTCLQLQYNWILAADYPKIFEKQVILEKLVKLIWIR